MIEGREGKINAKLAQLIVRTLRLINSEFFFQFLEEAK